MVISIPLLLSFDKKVSFYKSWRYFFPAMIITAILFLIWDVLFTQWGVWGFNDIHLQGINIINLPIEEWLFFVTIPYAVVFTYSVLNVWVPMKQHPGIQKSVSTALFIILITGAIFYSDCLYSLVTFSLTAIFVAILEWSLKARYLLHFYRTYLVTMLPFLITNGILTGYGLEEPVVWYNNSFNSGIRIETIPIEDVAYGFLLVGLNVSLFEKFRRKAEANN